MGSFFYELPQPTPFDALFDNIGAFFRRSTATRRDVLVAEAGAADRRPARRAMRRAPSTIIAMIAVGQRPSEVAALSLPGTVFAACYAVWKEAAGDAANGNWHRGAVSSLERLAIGHYVGETDLNVAARAERSYTPETWQRLRALRRASSRPPLRRLSRTGGGRSAQVPGQRTAPLAPPSRDRLQRDP
jgi:hypothetical protein